MTARGDGVTQNGPPTTALRMTVNDEVHELDLDNRTTLLDALREPLGLTGSKKGCDHGQCGACTVLLDGRRVNSCLILAVGCNDAEVHTIEGLAGPDDLHPVQRAFLAHDGFQCGYCTPGQIVSAVGMLDELDQGWPSAVTGDDPPTATAAEIRERMSGNLCRCGAYVGILEALTSVVDSAGRSS